MAFLLSLPSVSNEQQLKQWILPFICLVLLLTTSPTTYGSYFFLVLYCSWRTRKYPQFFRLWFIGLLWGALYFYLRNWVLFGDGETFHQGYRQLRTDYSLTKSIRLLV